MPPPPHRILERIRTNPIKRHAHQATKTRGFATHLVREGAAFPFFVLFSRLSLLSITNPTHHLFLKKKREGPDSTDMSHALLSQIAYKPRYADGSCVRPVLPCPHQRQGARAKSAKRRVLVQRQRDAVVVEHVVPLCSTGSCVSVFTSKTSEACRYFTCCLLQVKVATCCLLQVQ